jgi:DNA-binding NarL/FixJ family response regulator
MAIRVVLVDDHPLFREGVRHALERSGGIQVVGEASSAREAYAMVPQLRPDVVVLDIGLPGMSGVSAVRELRRLDAEQRILMLTVHSDGQFADQAFAAGAMGFATKAQPSIDIVDALVKVSKGERYMSPAITGGNRADTKATTAETPIPQPLAPLSNRERDVFDLLARGYSNSKIAAELFISAKTVETHRAHIFRKLRVHSIVELVRFAVRHRLFIEADLAPSVER